MSGVTIGALNAITGTDGTFRATVEPGAFSLTVFDNEDELDIVSPKLPEGTLEIPAGGMSDLAITVEPRNQTLRGVVIGADGKPAADAWVIAIHGFEAELDPDSAPDPGSPPDPPDLSSYAFDWTGRKNVALTDADGRFAISGLRAGNYDVAAEGAKGAARGVTRNAPADRPVPRP